jgi:signal transduction histidine kinase
VSRRRAWPPAVRVRLTLLSAGAIFLSGAALVALMYGLMAQALDRQLTVRLDAAPGLAEGVAAAGQRIMVADVHEELRAQFREDRDATLRAMLVASLAALGLVGLLSGTFGWLLAGQALQPLLRITATARRVADRSLHERIALEGPDDEIKHLADTFDAMLERLDRSFDSQRRIVANASHELRTPLTINRTLIEVALEDPGASDGLRQLGSTLLAVNERHERLIDGLLTLAASEGRVRDPVRVDLAEIVRHVRRESAAAAQRAAVDVRTQLAPARVLGDPLLLERLVQNLVDNAVRYNLAEAGWVALAVHEDGGQVVLQVENPGEPVPSYEISSLFQPFRRLSSAERLAAGDHAPRRGAGLGLSIVQAIAQAHGGEVAASARADGGLLVRVSLPGQALPWPEAPHVHG